jgi:threonine/homoserine/homoserine lactone efflux protein
MPEPTAFLVFMVATLTLNLTPGPDMLYVIARSAGQGRAAGIASALGIAGGCLVHTAAVAFGLSRLLSSVPAAYQVVQYAGAAYLLYLGVRTLVRRGNDEAGADPEPENLWVVFRQGVTTNVLNPKVALFFLAFLPQFADARRGSLAAQLLLLGTVFNVSGTLVNIGVALAASGAGSWLKRRLGTSSLLRWATGAIFIGLGVRLAFLDRRS